MASPVGMLFNIDPHGNLIAQPSFANPGAPPADTPYGGDWTLCVTGLPAGSSANTVAALVQANAVLGFPFTPGGAPTPLRFTVSYAALQAGNAKLSTW